MAVRVIPESPPERATPTPVEALAEALATLARNQAELAVAVRRLNGHLEVLQAAMPARREAELLGVSERTVRRRRAVRAAERLLEAGV